MTQAHSQDSRLVVGVESTIRKHVLVFLFLFGFWSFALGQVGQQIQSLDPNYGNSGGAAGGTGNLYTETLTIDMSMFANRGTNYSNSFFEVVESGGCPVNPDDGCSGAFLGDREMCDGSTEGPDFLVTISNIDVVHQKSYASVNFTICRRGDYGHSAEKVYVVDENDTVIAFVDSSGGGSTTDCTPQQQCVTATISGCDYSDLASDGTISLAIHCPGGNDGTTVADCDAVCNSVWGRRDGDYNNDGIVDGNCVELTSFSVDIKLPDLNYTVSSTSPCVGQTVVLTPSSNDPIFDQSFTANGANIGTGTTNWIPSAEGTYTICNVVGSGDCEEESCQVITVTNLPDSQDLTIEVCAETDFNPYDYEASINPSGSGVLYLFTDNSCDKVIHDNTTFNITGVTAFPADPSGGGDSNSPSLAGICSGGSTPSYNSIGGIGSCDPPVSISSESECTYFGGTWSSGTMVTLFANENTEVDENNPNGTWTTDSTIDVSGRSGRKRSSLFRFDDVNNTSKLPSGVTITSAILTLTVETDPDPSLAIAAHEMLASWSQVSSTWNNTLSDYNATAELTDTVFRSDTTVEMDITSLVSQWYSTGTNYGVMVRPNETFNKTVVFYSITESISSRRPKLEITYAAGGGTCSGAATVNNTSTTLCALNNGTFTGAAADQISQTVKYIILDNGCTTEGTVTFNVNIADPVLSAQATVLCDGDEAVVTAPAGAASYDFFIDNNPENGMKDVTEPSLDPMFINDNVATIPVGTGSPLPVGSNAVGVVVVSAGYPCEGTNTITMTVEAGVPSNNVELSLCDDDNSANNDDEDGSAVFTLADAEDATATSNINSGLGQDVDDGATGVTVSYYPTMADAEAKSMNTLSSTYASISSSEVIYARVEDDMTGCYSVATVTLNVSDPADLFPGLDFIMCQGDVITLSGATMTTSTAAWSIQSGTGGTLSNELQTSSPDTVSFTANTAGSFVLRLTSADPSGVCGSETRDINVSVNSAPTANNTTIYACENTDAASNVALFDLTDADLGVTGGVANISAVYYETEQNAIDDVNALDELYASANATIYARVFNLSTDCFSTSQVTLVTYDELVVSSISDESVCVGRDQGYKVVGSLGSAPYSYQWQESIDSGTSFSNISNGMSYSGATTDSLTLLNVQNASNNYQYRLILSDDNGCMDTSNVSTLTVFDCPIDAVDDDFTSSSINGKDGGSVGDLFDNDLLEGVQVDTADVTLTAVAMGTTDISQVYLDGTTGDVVVEPGTPAGDYNVVYRICEVINPTNCDEATITVRVDAASIDAVDDDFTSSSINGKDGGSVGDLYDNDTLNGVQVDTSEITLTAVALGTTDISQVHLDGETGEVIVEPGTAAGDYDVVYRICEDLNPTNCDEATITVRVIAATIDAVDDDFTASSINGKDGGSIGDLYDNDTLNGVQVDTSEITLTAVALGTTDISQVHLDGETGEVVVEPGTAAGDYDVVYRICEDLNPANCDEATVTVRVEAAPIDAVDDDFTASSINGKDGGNIGDLYDNDTLNGVQVDTSEITLTAVALGTTDISQVHLDGETGEVIVEPGTAAGDYDVVYRICEDLNPTNCDEATITVRVSAAPIDALDDDFTASSINGKDGGSIGDLYDNDSLNGVQVDTSEITLTAVALGTTDINQVYLDGETGEVIVEPGTAAGDYDVVYRICEDLNPTNCDEATITVRVTAAPIDAIDDNFTANVINGKDGGSIGDLYDNDTLNGVQVDTSEITLTAVALGTTDISQVHLDGETGEVIVEPGTAAGDYNVVYRICEDLNPTNCDEATITVRVSAATIDAVDDDFTASTINGKDGGSIGDLYDNDTLNGVQVDTSEITLTAVALGTTDISQVHLDGETGEVVVEPGTAAGDYDVVYRICEDLNPTNCDEATVTVRVEAAPIDAVDDDFTASSINGKDGGSIGDLYDNDTLNGVQVDTSEITLTAVALGTTDISQVHLDGETGEVIVEPGTPAGDYYVVYRICEDLNPTNCDEATITVRVSAAPIDAVDDDFTASSINGKDGGSVGDLYVNDLLNGVQVDTSEVTLTAVAMGTTDISQVYLDGESGEVIVEPGTSAGDYDVVYRICEDLNPTNCDEATITVRVDAAPIDAVDDDFTASPINGKSGGSIGDLYDNDLLNGVKVDTSDISLSAISIGTTDINQVYLDGESGEVIVEPGTPAGDYDVVYRICEDLNPGNCDEATVTVRVEAAEIDAVDDDFTASPINGKHGGRVGDLNDNDLLNGIQVDTSEVTLTAVALGTTDISQVYLDGESGEVVVEPGTSAGDYDVVYRICEDLNPTNCDEATITVRVDAAPIDAVDDNFTSSSINGKDGGSVGDLYDNDLLNGVQVDTSDVTLAAIALGTTDIDQVYLEGESGEVIVEPGTPAGDYDVVYSICEDLNPTNCDEATITVRVEAAAIDAMDDDYTSSPINGKDGGLTADILENDLLNGAPVDPEDISITPIAFGTTDIDKVHLDGITGKVLVEPGTPAGDYDVVYRICENLNPGNCDEAVVSVRVEAAAIDAMDDDYTSSPINGKDGGSVGELFDNDLLNGIQLDPKEVTLTPVTFGTTNIDLVHLDGSNGEVVVEPGTPAGDYDVVYRICEDLNPTNCDEATITVRVEAAQIDAMDDDYTSSPINGKDGGLTADILDNDLLNDTQVDPEDISITPIAFGTTDIDKVHLDGTTGKVLVEQGTPAGDYDVVYKICENLNPTNCDEAVVTVRVEAALIDAMDDDYTSSPINGKDGGLTSDILENDLLNGAQVDPEDISITPIALGTTDIDKVHLDGTTGKVLVEPGTPVGDYEVVYQICENLNPTNCDEAVVTVRVEAALIDAINDDYTSSPINGKDGGLTTDILENDLLNGAQLDPEDITITPIAFGTTDIDMVHLDGTTGKVKVEPGTPAGDYEVVYQICENLNPSNCDEAVVTVRVEAAQIDAINDDYTSSPINGKDGGLTTDILDNDLLNGKTVNPDDITLTPISLGTTDIDRVHLDGTTGKVLVEPGTPSGDYDVVYRICENLNPSNCDDAIVTVRVHLIPELEDDFAIVDEDEFVDIDIYDNDEDIPSKGTISVPILRMVL